MWDFSASEVLFLYTVTSFIEALIEKYKILVDQRFGNKETCTWPI